MKSKWNWCSTIVIALFLSCTGLSATAYADVHSVWVQDPLYIHDGDTGKKYKATSTTMTMNWEDGTTSGFFHAIGTTPDGNVYEFRLLDIDNANASTIQGFWEISKNGNVVCNNCVGQALQLDEPIGQYIKLYTNTNPPTNAFAWHISGYITNRLDY